MKIVIVGHGFVGKAVDYGFPVPDEDKIIIDPKYGKTFENTYLDFGWVPTFVFVCVPTPMGKDGEIDASIIEETMYQLHEKNPKANVIIKSTITPEIVKRLELKYNFVYNPEFLTEKSANEDFVNPFMHVFGGYYKSTKEVEELYKFHSLCKPCPVYHMSAVDASFVKYGINAFLATKVLWFNQFYDVVKDQGGNFNKIVSAITQDNRVARSHTTVPGFDGKRGFGGACFPKDTAAFLKMDPSFTVLKEVIDANNEYRRQYEKDSREMEQNINYE